MNVSSVSHGSDNQVDIDDGKSSGDDGEFGRRLAASPQDTGSSGALTEKLGSSAPTDDYIALAGDAGTESPPQTEGYTPAPLPTDEQYTPPPPIGAGFVPPGYSWNDYS